MRKRLLSFVLAVLMIASLLPAAALAADVVASGTCGAEGDGSNLTWTLDSEGTLTIRGTGAMYSYWNTGIVGFNTPWRNLMVKHVIIQDGVTSIGSYAFIYNHTIESVEISGTVQTIEGNAFQGTHLKSVTIPDNVTSIGREAFQDCTSLKNIALSNGVQHLGYVFGGCTALESVTIPSGVTSMRSTFEGCTSLKNITFLGGVTSIKGAFRNCTALTTVTLPDGIEDITNAFEGCTALTNVTLPDSVEDISSAFSGCTALADITLPRNLKTINGAFAGCASLTDIAVAEENPYFCTMSGIVYSKDQKTIAAYPAGRPDTAFAIPEGTTGIGNGAFYGCTNLTHVTIPEGVTSIGDRAFYTCTGLTEITIPDSVTAIGGSAFSGCKSLKSIAIPDGVTRIEGFAFVACESLESVVIPGTVTEIGNVAFNNGDHIKDVYFLGTKDAWQKVSIESENEAITENATIHYFSEWTREKEPTCTETGSETSTCSAADCGKTFTHEIPALGHSWDEGKVTKPATETEDGVKTFTCTRCSVTRTEAIPALSHEHSYKEVVTAPTCTEKGYTTHTCACGDSYVDTYTDALGHAWDNGKVTKPATETETGTKTFTCTRCGETKTETIPKLPHEHSYKDVVTAPTCTAKGYTTHTCACGDSYVDTYTDALGHAWDNGKVTKPATETEDGVKTFTCTRCSETKTKTIPATGSVNVTEMFTDVSHSWADDGIQYCVAYQLMSGVGDNLFAPKMTTTRAQIVQILYNLEGEPKVSGTMPFTDLTQNWYKDAVLWSYQTGVVVGTSATTFEPDQPVTREQIAVILMEYVTKVLKLERTWTPADLSVFPDAGSVSDWAKDALADAVALGLISGASNGGVTLLEPQGSATREQVATILMEFCKNVKK